jgi:hypothetical protein
MKHLSFAATLYSFFVCNFAMATIFDMEELYNSTTGQTIMLMGDYHSKVLPDVDKKQLDAIMTAVKKYNPQVLIEEEEGTVSVFPFLLTLVYDACKAQQASYAGIDFRWKIGYLLYRHREAIQEKGTTLDSIQLRWSKGVYEKDMVLLLRSALDDVMLAMKAAIEYQYELRVKQAQNAWAGHTDMILALNRAVGVLGRALALRQALDGMTDAHQDALAWYIQNSFRATTHGLHWRENSFYDLAFEVASDAFDVHILTEIYKRKNCPLIFLVAGGAHTNNVSEILQGLGYQSKHRILSTKKQKERWEKAVARYGDEDAVHVKGSWVNIDAFLEKSTALSALSFGRGTFFASGFLSGAAVAAVLLGSIVLS